MQPACRLNDAADLARVERKGGFRERHLHRLIAKVPQVPAPRCAVAVRMFLGQFLQGGPAVLCLDLLLVGCDDVSRFVLSPGDPILVTLSVLIALLLGSTPQDIRLCRKSCISPQHIPLRHSASRRSRSMPASSGLLTPL